MKASNKPKIAFAITDLRAGGAERILSYTADRLSQKGYDVSLICYYSDTFKKHYEIDSRIKIHFILSYQANTDLDRLRTNELQRVLRDSAPDVVVSFLDNMNIYCSQACDRLGIAHIACERNCPWRQPASGEKRMKRDQAFQHSTACVFQTPQQATYFGDQVKGRSFLLPNPTILDAPPLPVDHVRKKSIVAVGRYTEQKDYPRMLRAFRAFLQTNKDYHLHCYGKDCGAKASLERYICSNNLERYVTLHDEIQNIHQIIRESEFFLMTSKYEGMPNALAEALALGLICITLDSEGGGPGKIIQDKYNGILLPIDAEDAQIASAISYCVSHPEFCDEIRKNCITDTAELGDRYIAGWERIIDKVIKSHESE